jgi:uncharacterized protein YhbP (UPF0306 family)
MIYNQYYECGFLQRRVRLGFNSLIVLPIMVSDLNTLARNIIAENQYMTIASRGPDGTVWASPVVYVPDKDYNIYYISLPDSNHSKNIAAAPNVTVAIFDSHQNFGEGVGLQIEGVITQVPIIQLPFVITLYLGRTWPYANDILQSYLAGFQRLLKNRSYKAYIFTPIKVWMNNPNEKTDVRVEVFLKK